MEKVISIHPSISDYSLVIAVDFGTTRSGFVYCFLDHGAEEISSSNVHSFDDWSVIHGYQDIPSYAKTRTELLYKQKKFYDWGWGARKKSGQNNGNLLKWFKLNLQEKEEYFTEGGSSYNTVEVVSDYLKSIKNAALDFIHDDLNFRIPDESILWCLTVPAIWNDLAVDRMKKAAIKATLVKEHESETRLLFVREPEAAAVHCYFNQLNNTLQPNDTFMVIDAGGGTIDLTSYKVSYNKTLEEIAKSSGGNNGSSFIDQNFILYLAYLGLDIEKVYADDKLLDLQISWESLKHAIQSDELSYSLQIKNLSYYNKNHEDFIKKLTTDQNGIEDEIILTPSTIKELFNPSSTGMYKKFYQVFEGVKNNIQDHINSLKDQGIDSVNYVFLVGGFNKSKLLNNFIINNFKSIVNNDIKKFVKPLRPEQAIMEGACIYAINPSIIHSRISKLTYGLRTMVPYDSNTHKGRRHQVFEGIDYCFDVFKVICEKNESISYNQSKQVTYTPVEKHQNSMPIAVFCSDNKSPAYVDDKGVKKLAEVNVPMPGYGLDREVEVRFYFGKADIQIEAKNVETNEIKKLSVKFSSSFG